jgi:hypothetical protein
VCRIYAHIVEINNCLNYLGVAPEGSDASGGDVANQEIQLWDGDHALLLVEDQAVGGEDGEQRAEGRLVLLSGLAEDPVII